MRDAVILVTGGTGFIGEALCRAFAASGSRVVSASRRSGISNTSVQHSQVDFADPDATRKLVRSMQPDYVFHLASYVTGQTGAEHVLPSLSANLLTTVHLMLALQESACRRMILAGSLVEVRRGNSLAGSRKSISIRVSNERSRGSATVRCRSAQIPRPREFRDWSQPGPERIGLK
jgi:nucleoside-diphosphate-sugar epimerase